MNGRKKGTYGFTRKVLFGCIILLVLANIWNYIAGVAESLVLVKFGLAQSTGGPQGLEGQAIAANIAIHPWAAQAAWPETINVRTY